MQAFVLDPKAALAAKGHCDKHVIKTIVECTQILYTSLFLLSIPTFEIACHTPEGDCFVVKPYSVTHSSHPVVLWILGGRSHFSWLLQLALQLCARYTLRFKKKHSSEYHLEAFANRIDFNTLPDDADVLTWIHRLREKGISENAILSCAERVATQSPPEGCLFGVCCIDHEKLGISEILGNRNDVVRSYREYYAFKAKTQFAMQWDGSSTIPEHLTDAFQRVLPERAILTPAAANEQQ
jgi:hypothetical protein